MAYVPACLVCFSTLDICGAFAGGKAYNRTYSNIRALEDLLRKRYCIWFDTGSCNILFLRQKQPVSDYAVRNCWVQERVIYHFGKNRQPDRDLAGSFL
jgi:hypothetical protein